MKRRLLFLLVSFTFLAGCAGSVTTQPQATTSTDTAASTTSTASQPGGTPSTPNTASQSTITSDPAIGTTLSPDGTAQDVPATALVDRLVVAAPDESVPYRRKAFGSGWDYDPATKCNTRELVLAEESGPGLVVDAKCKPQTGTWTSLYDGVVTHDPSDLEIDHLVPLADAWRSGAAHWTPERRREFANDLTDPATLVAVTSNSNRSKQDSTPADWLPPNFDDRCRYVSDWVRVKYRWGLTVTPQEKSTLVQILSGC